jgi:hypothetical protein
LFEQERQRQRFDPPRFSFWKARCRTRLEQAHLEASEGVESTEQGTPRAGGAERSKRPLLPEDGIFVQQLHRIVTGDDAPYDDEGKRPTYRRMGEAPHA